MQANKNFTPKLFVNFRLDEAVPDDNFYKILKRNLDLNFIDHKKGLKFPISSLANSIKLNLKKKRENGDKHARLAYNFLANSPCS